MKSVLVVGLAIIAVLPAIGILSLFIYKIYDNLRKKGFEKRGNIVLDRKRIGDVIENKQPTESIKIFKSAICDHSKVNGLRYYTKFPFGLKIISPHDNHRKALIAHEIGKVLTKEMIYNENLEFCIDILFCLTKYSTETYYTQLLAWDSLSKLMYFQKINVIEMIGIDYLYNSISKDLLAGIGIIKFIFIIRSHSGSDNNLTINKIINEVIFYTLEMGSMPIIALLVFKLKKNPYFDQSQKKVFINKLPNDPKLQNFMKHMGTLSLGFIKEELSEGLRNLGFQPHPYSKNTTEGEIVQFLLKEDFLEEIYIPSSYMLRSFDWNNPREQLSDFLWI